ncbi:hypothetical protein J0H58_16995 [bacterium]|nr:hypothetical protein [bacterium]
MSPLTEAVQDLNLSGNAIGPAGIAAFTARAATLKTLKAADTGLTAADRRRLKNTLPALTG